MTTLMGIAIVICCVIIAILWPGAGEFSFFSAPSLFCVLGGIAGAALASYPMPRLVNLFKAAGCAFRSKHIDFIEEIDRIVDIAEVARQEGLVQLEDIVAGIGNPFLRKGITLIGECSGAELVQRIMETDIELTRERHRSMHAAFSQLAAFAVAFGLLGTLIGMFRMLVSLGDIAALGPGMAFALLSVLYGLLIANAVFTPLAKRLKSHSEDEYLHKEIQLEGLVSIMNGVPPPVIRQHLNSFLSRRIIEKAGKAKTAAVANEKKA